MEVFNNLCQATQRILGSCFRSGVARFASADTIVPNPMNPQDFNRYSYVSNNPLGFIDPSGHFSEEAIQDYIWSICEDSWTCFDTTLANWQGDDEWWNMLSYAEAGDVLLLYSGDIGLFYAFTGEGKDLLTGIVHSRDPYGLDRSMAGSQSPMHGWMYNLTLSQIKSGLSSPHTFHLSPHSQNKRAVCCTQSGIAWSAVLRWKSSTEFHIHSASSYYYWSKPSWQIFSGRAGIAAAESYFMGLFGKLGIAAGPAAEGAGINDPIFDRHALQHGDNILRVDHHVMTIDEYGVRSVHIANPEAFFPTVTGRLDWIR